MPLVLATEFGRFIKVLSAVKQIVAVQVTAAAVQNVTTKAENIL